MTESRRAQLYIGLVLRLGLCLTVGLIAGCTKPDLPELPALPEASLEVSLPAVQEAIRKAYREASEAPRDAPKVGRLAMILAAHGFNAEAARAYSRVRVLEPDNPNWPYFHGHLLAAMGDRAEAEAALTEALEIDSNHPDAAAKLAGLLWEEREIAKSEALYKTVLAAHPDHIPSLYGYGQLLASENELERASEQFEKALRLDDSVGEIHYALAQVCRRRGDAEGAKRHLTAFEQRKENQVAGLDEVARTLTALHAGDRPHLLRAQALYRNRRFAEAITELKIAAEINPASVAPHIHLIQLYAQTADYASAQRHYQLGLELQPNEPQLHHNWGAAQRRRGRFEEAKAALERALELDPSDAKIHAELGYVASRMGDTRTAIERYRQCLEIDPHNHDAAFLLSQTLIEIGRYADGIEQLQRILTPEGPRTAVFLRAQAEAYVTLKKYDEAESALRRAHELANVKIPNVALRLAIEKDLSNLAGLESASSPGR